MIGPLDRGIYLASRSPRRRELLSQIGVRYHLLLFRSRPDSAPDVDESILPNEQPDTYVERVARAKVQAGWRLLRLRNLPFAPVLSADTTVALDGRVLRAAARRLHRRGADARRAHRLGGVALGGPVQAAEPRGDRAVHRHRRVRRQGRGLCRPGARGAVYHGAARQLLRGHGAAALRDRPAP